MLETIKSYSEKKKKNLKVGKKHEHHVGPSGRVCPLRNARKIKSLRRWGGRFTIGYTNLGGLRSVATTTEVSGQHTQFISQFQSCK